MGYSYTFARGIRCIYPPTGRLDAARGGPLGPRTASSLPKGGQIAPEPKGKGVRIAQGVARARHATIMKRADHDSPEIHDPPCLQGGWIMTALKFMIHPVLFFPPSLATWWIMSLFHPVGYKGAPWLLTYKNVE